MKWSKSGEFSDFHSVFTLKFWVQCCIASAGGAFRRKWAPSRAAYEATDGDGCGVFENKVVSSNPLIEICLLVPFPPPSTQGVSECTPPATSPGTHDPGFHPR